MYGAQRYGQNKYTGIVLDYHKVVRPVIGGPTVNLPAQDWLARATPGGDFPIPVDQAQLTLALATPDQFSIAAVPQFFTQAIASESRNQLRVVTAGQLTVPQSASTLTVPVPASGRFTVNIPVDDRITRGLN